MAHREVDRAVSLVLALDRRPAGGLAAARRDQRLPRRRERPDKDVDEGVGDGLFVEEPAFEGVSMVLWS